MALKENPDLEDALSGEYGTFKKNVESELGSSTLPGASNDSSLREGEDNSSSMNVNTNTDNLAGSSNFSDGSSSEQNEQRQRVSLDKQKHEYNPQRVKEFLIRVAKAVKRYQIRMHARKKFHNHVEKFKEPPQQRKNTIDDDIVELKRHVANLIEVERNPHHPAHSKYVKEKIAVLEYKLDELLEMKKKRETRFNEIEERINKKIYEDKQLIAEVEKKLLHMERDLLKKQIEHHQKRKGIPKELEELKQKIATTKRSLDLLKQSRKVISHVP